MNPFRNLPVACPEPAPPLPGTFLEPAPPLSRTSPEPAACFPEPRRPFVHATRNLPEPAPPCLEPAPPRPSVLLLRLGGGHFKSSDEAEFSLACNASNYLILLSCLSWRGLLTKLQFCSMSHAATVVWLNGPRRDRRGAAREAKPKKPPRTLWTCMAGEDASSEILSTPAKDVAMIPGAWSQ